MKRIYSAYSHLDIDKKSSEKAYQRSTNNEEVLKSEPKKVESYEDLVGYVARIAFYNRDFHLFYRGQSSDYKENGKTVILPSIFRKRNGERQLYLKRNFSELDDAEMALLSALKKRDDFKWAGTSIAKRYQEVRWAILQHYTKVATPFIDLTHSLHVACSFALDPKWNHGDTAIIHVLGMPAITESISYYVSAELLNIRLLNFFMPSAKRPYFQEGYVAAPFPKEALREPSKKDQFDFGRRLVAKFEIPNDPEKFFGKHFQVIPRSKLYPNENDRFFKYLQGLGFDMET